MNPLEVANLLVYQSHAPLPRISRALGFEAVEEFEVWFRSQTGALPRRSRAGGGGGRQTAAFSMVRLRQALMRLLSEEQVREVLRALEDNSGHREEGDSESSRR